MTQFYRWLMEQVNDPEFGDLAVFIRDHPEIVSVRQTEAINLIGGELFSRHVSRPLRVKMRAAHKEWRASKLREKFGEWPIRTGVVITSTAESREVKRSRLESEIASVEKQLAVLRKRLAQLGD